MMNLTSKAVDIRIRSRVPQRPLGRLCSYPGYNSFNNMLINLAC